MRILISAAETSSDVHGAELLKAIREQLGDAAELEAFGIGGPQLQQAGLKVIVDARELLAMGFTEILGRLPTVLRALRQMTQAASRMRPDVAVLIDYPDFHFRLARRLSRLGIPLIYYIPPKTWVWRKRRVQLLRRLFVRILCILPFEEDFYRSQNVAVKYVGNPLVDELPIDLTREAARSQLALELKEKVLVLMPGSRLSELKQHFDLMLDAAGGAAEILSARGYLKAQEKLQVLMPFPVTVDFQKIRDRFQKRSLRSPLDSHLNIRLSQGDAGQCLVAADSGLIKSGTSTLEAGLLRCPHTIVYKTTRMTAWIYKNLIRYRGPVGLVNLVAQGPLREKEGLGSRDSKRDYLVKELVLDEVTLTSLRDEIVSLMTEPEKCRQMIRGFEVLRDQVCGKTVRIRPSHSAAREVIGVMQAARRSHL